MILFNIKIEAKVKLFQPIDQAHFYKKCKILFEANYST